MFFKSVLPLVTLAAVVLAHPQPYQPPDVVELDAREDSPLVESPIGLEERDEPLNVERNEDIYVERDEYINVERDDFTIAERDAFEAALRRAFDDEHDLVARDRTGRCPAGKRAVSKGVSVVPNGCGPADGVKVPDFAFGSCCNTHDRCYGDCSKSKAQCEVAFHNCMMGKCAQLWPPFVAQQCATVAAVYFTAVSLAGGKAFKAATTKHCKCV